MNAIHGQVACSIPWLRALAAPPLGFGRSVTSDPYDAITARSSAPSGLPSSTTRISVGRAVWRRMLSNGLLIVAAALYAGMTTLIGRQGIVGSSCIVVAH